MKSQQIRLASLISLALVFAGAPMAQADTDPFPGVAYQAEIPGTRITSSPGVTQAAWEASSTYQSWRTTHCPTGSGMGIGSDMNFTTSQSDDTWYAYCIKTWQSQATLDAWATYRSTLAADQAAALLNSQQWNAANPGQQKCFQWGPITDPNGGTSSGGVCANPVPVPSGSSQDSATVSSSPTQESSTVSSSPSQETTTSSTPTPTPTQSSAPAPVNTNGFGGYAVVHPDGHVCGVIVSGSNDPFNNGGVMPQEYMGCPAGSRIVFQSAPSESGNVAGWHGENVRLNGDTYSLPGGSTISGGIVTDTNGRTWNSGTGQTITPGNVDTSTVLSDTRTTLSETSTVSIESITTLAVPMALALPMATNAETITPIDDLDALPEVDAEEEISHSIDARVVNNKTRIEVSTAWESTRLALVATKKGSKKKYTYRFSTDSSGNYIFKSSLNLKGFTLALFKGSEELVREIV